MKIFILLNENILSKNEKYKGVAGKCINYRSLKKKSNLIVKCVLKDFNNFMCRFKTVLLRVT